MVVRGAWCRYRSSGLVCRGRLCRGRWPRWWGTILLLVFGPSNDH